MACKPCGKIGLDEAACLAALRSGDPSAFAELTRHCAGWMMAVARRFLRCEFDADDAVQEAFLAAFRASGKFEHDLKLSAWLHRVVVNACLMKLRLERSRRRRFTRNVASAPTPA